MAPLASTRLETGLEGREESVGQLAQDSPEQGGRGAVSTRAGQPRSCQRRGGNDLEGCEQRPTTLLTKVT